MQIIINDIHIKIAEKTEMPSGLIAYLANKPTAKVAHILSAIVAKPNRNISLSGIFLCFIYISNPS